MFSRGEALYKQGLFTEQFRKHVHTAMP